MSTTPGIGTSMDAARQVGLDLVLPLWNELWQTTFTVEPPRLVLGSLPWAGTPRPTLSSMARVHCASGSDAGDDYSFWIPAPLPDTGDPKGPAPLFEHSSHTHVLPIIRLLVDRGEPDSKRQVDFDVLYRDYSHWLHDAFTRWQFAAYRKTDGTTKSGFKLEPTSVLEWLRERKPPLEVAARGLAQMIRYALFGSDQPWALLGLRIPACPMWLRPVEGTTFMASAARHLLITARLRQPRRGVAGPTTDLRSARFRIHPGSDNDWGIDPVHTPEGGDIRLTARLGLGVTINADGKLDTANSPETVPLSVSGARLPYAGYNDPRRLLMAANMQLHAIHVDGQQTPIVRKNDRGMDPPGTNLRTAYLAWQGWNHEDAWVISASAALKLGTVQERVHVLPIRAVEMPPRILVEKGQQVARGQLLIERQAAPLLLTTALPVLSRLLEDNDTVRLQPEDGDIAAVPGVISNIEEVSFLDSEAVDVSPELTSSHRGMIRITVKRALPLQVGDKLANRHGHKGIVGAILPDDAMPRWQGEPLEALIDPVSVLNRSNWGQVLETLAGGLAHLADNTVCFDHEANKDDLLGRMEQQGGDALGRSMIEPAQADSWMPAPTRAVAGVQFVMRLPHHAADKLSGSPMPPPGSSYPALRKRAQRLGEMDQWALWAHDVLGPMPKNPTLSPPAQNFARLLASAGISVDLANNSVQLRRTSLDQAPPADALPLPYTEGTLAEVFDCLEEVADEPMQALTFNPPVTGVPLAGVSLAGDSLSEDADSGRPTMDIAWLPILPASDRKPRRLASGREEVNPLTLGLRRIIRAARHRAESKEVKAGTGKDTDANAGADEADNDLRFALADLMNEAYALAVGTWATGQGSSKFSFLSRRLMGFRQARSARATISPGGSLELALDEIGLPPALAWTLFGPKLPDDPAQRAEAVNGRPLWLKRDPVLHRWGFIPVRARLVDGHTVRMPASLLGPLGADFDGDTVALFAQLPWDAGNLEPCKPAKLAWHRIVDRAMLLPTKQYLYGMHLLQNDPQKLQTMQTELAGAAAPAWPSGPPGQALKQWVHSTSEVDAIADWWGIVEKHALAALGADPGMGFGVVGTEALAALPAIAQGAAKNLVDSPPAIEAMDRILRGASLDIYRRGESQADPIAQVMVAAKSAIGRFGGALRRVLFSAQTPLSAGFVQHAQCLTEQITQQALSVKAGKPPLEYQQFERQLRRLLKGTSWETDDDSLRGILQPLDGVWQELVAGIAPEPPAWLTWLRQPFNLAQILHDNADGVLSLPLHDVRIRPWLNESEG